MNLIIDIGNTSAKLAIFNNGELVKKVVVPVLDLEIAQQLLNDSKSQINSAILSSVAEVDKDVINLLSKLSKFIYLSVETKLPIENCYETPNSLGVDRIAAVIGCSIFFSNKPILVIDAGTAITYEFLNTKNQYLGGSISPGIETRFKSLHTFTKKLPLISTDKIINRSNVFQLVGNSSETCIISGVLNGLSFEIDGVIEKYKTLEPEINVIGTGGDINFLVNNLKNSIFVEPNLVLMGLNKILDYNV